MSDETPTPPGVVIAYIFPEDTSGWFTQSLTRLTLFDAYSGDQFLHPTRGGVIGFSSSPRIAEARNKVIDTFATEFPDADWLLFLDSDMTFDADLLRQLMANADRETAPVVGGLCFSARAGSPPVCTIYKQVKQERADGTEYISIDRVYDYPENAMLRVGATGGACLLIHRGVLAAMKKAYGDLPDGRENPYPWFADGVVGPNGESWGEDTMFCLRVNQIGASVWVHTGVKLGHVKTHIVDEEFYKNYRRSVELTAEGAFDDPKPNRAERRAAARKKAAA